MWEVFRTNTNNGGPSYTDSMSSVSDEQLAGEYTQLEEYKKQDLCSETIFLIYSVG